jgi:hypothetical protein
MATTPLSMRRFEIGRVVEQTFSVIGRNFVAFYLLALILGALPSTIAETASDAYKDGADFSAAQSLLAALSGLIGFVTSLLVQGALVWGAVADLNGRKPALGELLRHGLHRAVPILGISIVMAIGILFGLLLFIVGGVFLLILWCVAVPVTVLERPPGLEALSRSAALTKGCRWSILALLLVYGLISVLILVVLGFIGGIATLVGGLSLVLTTALLALSSAAVILIGAVGGACLYVELRSVKEGVEPETLASVFD